jgi:hypothetical protein
MSSEALTKKRAAKMKKRGVAVKYSGCADMAHV